MNEASNSTITTLLVKHLPDFITNTPELQQKYFRPYKPLDVRFMETSRMPGFVFLDFPDRDMAEKAYHQLRAINFGLYFKKVDVEYATPNFTKQQQQYTRSIIPAVSIPEENEKAADPISTTHSLLYPPNPHLKYYYPDPTPEIVTNISYAIASVPRLYTQVLHLMNKLNLPPPFGSNVKEAKPAILTKSQHQKDRLLASDESELEEEEEEEDDSRVRKRALSADIVSPEEKVKRIRLARKAAERQKEAIHQHNAASQKDATDGSLQQEPFVFSSHKQKAPMPTQPNNNKIKIIIDQSLEVGPPTHDNVQDMRDVRAPQEQTEKREDTLPDTTPLTDEQKRIKDRCLPMSELISLAAFRGYEAGSPHSKLYVKNLHKQVTQEDLEQIYGLFSKDVQIELKSKGKLKGQAFITFPDSTTAQVALDCTNGYPLKGDKPMAVQFGRATK